MENFLTKIDYKIFLIKSLGFLSFIWALFCITLGKVFYVQISIIILFSLIFLGIRYFRKNDLLKKMAEIDGQDIQEPEFCQLLDSLGIIDITEYEGDNKHNKLSD